MRTALVALGMLIALARMASAQDFQEGDSFDLYNGTAIGNVRILGMGGTAVGLAQGSAGVLANPAAAAVRLTTSKGSWDWDYHLDWVSTAGSDIDNNGDRNDERFGSMTYSGGLAGMVQGWGLAVVGTSQSTDLVGAAGEPLVASTTTTKIALAYEFLEQAYTAGLAVRIGSFSLAEANGTGLARNSGASLEVGGLWRPPRTDWRAGLTFSLPVSGHDLRTESGCDPLDCHGYHLPDGVQVPWQLGAGVAWRHVFGDLAYGAPVSSVAVPAPARSRWNQHIDADYRDERALLLAADVVVTGAVDDGYGLERFSEMQLQRSGEQTVVSVRGGAEYEWLPGRLRVRGGSYWEPGRFAGRGGRIHGTFGLEVSLVQFHVWRWTYRLRLSATVDGARHYANGGLSVGFWH